MRGVETYCSKTDIKAIFRVKGSAWLAGELVNVNEITLAVFLEHWSLGL